MQAGASLSSVMHRVSELDAQVGASRARVVMEEGIFKLLRFEALTEEKYRNPIMVVYAWINRPYVLDLQADISVVQKYLRVGFDVYMLDWGYATPADQYVDLDDYMDFLDRSVEYVKESKSVDRVNMHGYCLGGTLAAAYAAIRQYNVRNLVLQAAPIDFQTDNLIAAWARSLDPAKVVAAYRLAPGELLNNGFLLADPINLIMGKYEGFLGMLNAGAAASSFLRMDRWIFDSPAIPAAVYRQYITEWYHQNLLAKGEFQALGETVDLRTIRVPTLVLVAEHDHIVPPSSQKAILDLISSRDKQAFEVAKGHVGITTSRESHRELWPRVLMWLEARSEHGGNGHVRPRSLAGDKGRVSPAS